MKLTPLTCLFLWLGVWIAGVSGSAWALENGSPAEGKAPPAVKVEGYRSARFGMTEKEVLDAISKDFHLGPLSIKT